MTPESAHTVFIYRDDGVGAFSFRCTLQSLQQFLSPKHPIKEISGEEVREGQWIDEAAAFVMPGGRDLPYCAVLGEQGTANIRQFVENGGGYLGFCAGAYFASDQVIFAEGKPIEVLGERQLKFFPGDAVGPLYALEKFSYHDHNGAVAAKIDSNLGKASIYYEGGCYFREIENCGQGVEVLGYYSDNNLNLPAIVRCQVGKGVAVLSGVHVEVAPNAASSVNDKLAKTLKKHDPIRQKLMMDMLKHLNLNVL